MGDGFLMRQGFTLLWVGWQFDVPGNGLRVYTPTASDNGRPIRGLVRSDFVLTERETDHSLADRNHAAYAVLDPSSPDNVLTVRDTVNGAVVGSDTIVQQIRDIRDDDSIKAIVLRVDSPGGSAVASDVIWRELVITRDQKPARPRSRREDSTHNDGGRDGPAHRPEPDRGAPRQQKRHRPLCAGDLDGAVFRGL